MRLSACEFADLSCYMQRAGSLEAQISSYIPFLTAADLCDQNAERFSDKVALIDHRRRLTWREVRVLSDKLVLALREIGLSKDRPLLVQLPNCAELFLSRLACEKAGVACVTVSPFFRARELKPILDHTQPGAAMILRRYSRVDFYSLIHETGYSRDLELLVVGEDAPSGALSVDELLNRPLDLEKARAVLRRSRLAPLDTCQIATTSGSTGAPKCVEVRIYARLLTGSIQLQRFGIRSQDTIAPLGPIISGVSETLGYFGAALLGLRVVLPDQFDPEEALELFSREGVSFACVAPTMLAKMMNRAEKSRTAPKRLRGLASYGSVLTLSLAERIERALGVKVVQGYGTADYGGIAASFFDGDIYSRVATVGRPLEGNEVQVCGDGGEPLPAGETGHIRVRGLHAVGRYYKSPEFDAERWRDGYFDVREMGRFDRQGNLVVLGRSDDVIIRAAQNIYPEEVEALLVQHPSIQEAAVVGIPDPVYGHKVCAFVLLRPGHQISLSEVTDFSRKAGLAQFKLPELLEVLPELPKVPTAQKVDRNELIRIAKRRLAID